MDKISQLTGQTRFQPRKNKVASDKRFENNLQKAATPTQAPAAPKETNVLGEIQAVRPPVIDNAVQQLTEQTEQLLQKLEEYAAAIENPKKTLAEIEPMIRQIDEQARALDKLAGDSLPPDEELRDVAKQAALTANLEYFKFQRGDYI